jgi:hypothetical protein
MSIFCEVGTRLAISINDVNAYRLAAQDRSQEKKDVPSRLPSDQRRPVVSEDDEEGDKGSDGKDGKGVEEGVEADGTAEDDHLLNR